jgi:endonuclease/exonuclease/phosphatase family metal-dependent hydrolase
VADVRLASFNLENIFDRARALNQETWADGRPALEAVARLNQIFGKATYTATDRSAILTGLTKLGLAKSDDGGKFARLRQNRGHLLKRPTSGPPEVVATGRADWIGWVELKMEEVNEIATRTTAQVVRDVAADVVGVVEVDNRVALGRFNNALLPAVSTTPYPHVMVIDGNDDRGIDVGLMSRFPIATMRSHVDDRVGDSVVFSRDCPEYEIALPGGDRLLLLVNHFKSKGYGGQAASNARRLRQAQRVREIYDARRQEGVAHIAVLGDFNDTPASDPLSPLLGAGSELRDVSAHPTFVSDGRPGTFANGTASGKIDYILLSPALFARVQRAGVWRKGVWGGKYGTLWEIYAEMEKPVHAASDHAAVWVDLDI